jgi:hypothetical protein
LINRQATTNILHIEPQCFAFVTSCKNCTGLRVARVCAPAGLRSRITGMPLVVGHNKEDGTEFGHFSELNKIE